MPWPNNMAKKRAAHELGEFPSTPPGAAPSAVSLSGLLEQAALLRHAQELAHLSHVITGPDGSFEDWSDTLPRLIGIPPDQIVRSTRLWLDLIHPADRDQFRTTALEARRKGKRAQIEYRLWRRDAGWVHVRQVMDPIPGPRDAQGRRRWFNTLQDITAEKIAEARIQRLNRLYAMLSGVNSLVVRVRSREGLLADACNVAVRSGGFRGAWIGIRRANASILNPAAWSGELGPLLASPPTSLIESDPAYVLAQRVAEDGRPTVFAVDDLQTDTDAREVLKALGIASVAIVPLLSSGLALGVLVLYAVDASFFDDEELRLLQDIGRDLTFAMEYLDKSEKAAYLAYHDPVTDLPNRARFLERLSEQLTSADLHQGNVALLIFDIEHFKMLNDTFGRQAGDALLKAIAGRLINATPGRNIGRVGADVFAVAIPDLKSVDDLARGVQGRSKEIFGTPYTVSGAELRVNAKLGIALYPNDAKDGETLFRNAEAALKKAKADSESLLFYEQSMSERVSERLALGNKLHRALEQQQFMLHFQPKVSLESRKVMGVEALIRWNDPESGLVPPMEFIPLLESSGLIVPVGLWALGRAAIDHGAILASGLSAPRIAVNISAVQLRHRDFLPSLNEAVRSGVNPSSVELEITESVLMQDIESNIRSLKRIRDLGFELSLDDFGTGYSSLAYLAKLPIQTLKIDRSFIAKMQDDPDAMTLVSTMVSLAHSMKLKVVAEGVETEEQARILRLLRCDEMQGYLISKPLPVSSLIDYLRHATSPRSQGA